MLQGVFGSSIQKLRCLQCWRVGKGAECEQSGPGGCSRGVGKSSQMTQPRMKEREFLGGGKEN